MGSRFQEQIRSSEIDRYVPFPMPNKTPPTRFPSQMSKYKSPKQNMKSSKICSLQWDEWETPQKRMKEKKENKRVLWARYLPRALTPVRLDFSLWQSDFDEMKKKKRLSEKKRDTSPWGFLLVLLLSHKRKTFSKTPGVFLLFVFVPLHLIRLHSYKKNVTKSFRL